MAEVLWNKVAVHTGASALTVWVRLFILLSLKLFYRWPTNSCISVAEGAALYFVSWNEQLVQEYPRLL